MQSQKASKPRFLKECLRIGLKLRNNNMQLEQKLKELGWSQWYNHNAWVNSDMVPACLDHTNYPVSGEQAYKISTDDKERKKYLLAINSHVFFCNKWNEITCNWSN